MWNLSLYIHLSTVYLGCLLVKYDWFMYFKCLQKQMQQHPHPPQNLHKCCPFIQLSIDLICLSNHVYMSILILLFSQQTCAATSVIKNK